MYDQAAGLKRQVTVAIDRAVPNLVALSDWMYAHPEIGHQEVAAVERITAALTASGAQVARGVAGLATAFSAELPGPSHGPRIGILAEYDALPEVGHGCGHNIIATAALGAGLGLAAIGASLPGRIRLLGCPAEESAVDNAGGKIPMIDAGCFEGLDAALMIHPYTDDAVADESSLVAYGLVFEFFGHPAHAAANPHEGINALDAMIIFFSSVGLLRQQMRSDARVHGIITHGGTAPNVIPAHTVARFRVRATDDTYARDLVARVIACAEAGARAAGARMTWHEYARPYLDMRPNQTLGDLLRVGLSAVGRRAATRREGTGAGSTDFGNVSHVVPSAFAYLGICGPEAGWHTREVAAATITPRGHAAIRDGALLLACAAIDLLCDDALRAAARAEFDAMQGA